MKIHMVAVCGTGMGSLAGLFKEAGHEVKGSDKAFYPPMSERLEAWGIATMKGFDPANLDEDVDLVVVGNACRRDNPEARAAIDGGLRVMSFPEALAEFFIGDRRSIVVAGTHGKTTTTALLSFLLIESGRDSSFLVGGIPRDYGKSFRLGEGREFVVEGDEYDSAFFDKRPKFVHYRPDIAVLTSVEFDHADIYADMDAYRSAFDSFAGQLTGRGRLVACDDYTEVRAVAAKASCQTVWYGLGDGTGWRAQKISVDGGITTLDVSRDAKHVARVRSPLAGDHNTANVLAVLAVAEQLGMDITRAAGIIERFGGIARRMEIRGTAAGVVVIDDFAHHPTEVLSTIRATRERFPGSFLAAVFEPRTNTSRRKFFQERYASCFTGADQVAVVPPYDTRDIPEDERFDSERLVRDLSEQGLSARSYAGADEVVEDLPEKVPTGGVILVMSNGAFDNIHEKLLAALKARQGTS